MTGISHLVFALTIQEGRVRGDYILQARQDWDLQLKGEHSTVGL
jgi:hypothetical protein